MPKITVQVARQRYARVVVMEPDPDNEGQERPKRIIVNRSRRKGTAPIYKTVKVNDKNQPLPPRKCEECGEELTIGQKYRSIGIKRQYGGIIRYRCMNCPSWQPHEYSDSNWARVSQIQSEADVDSSGWESEEDAQGAAEAIAESIREFASEKQESADNVGEHFQGSEMAENLSQFAQDLEEWADRVEQAPGKVEFPEEASDEDEQCEECEGNGSIDCDTCGGAGEVTEDDQGNPLDESQECPDCEGGQVDCESCGGEGAIERDADAREEALSAWREEVQQAIQDELDNAAEWQG